jgi:hypothetical protein
VEARDEAALRRMDRRRKKKGSNAEWVNPHDPEAEITRMKDGRTALAYKAEHAVDMDTGAIVAVVHHTFTHSRRMDWILPGILPTNKKVAIDIVAVVYFRGDKICGERIYWDHSKVLRQIGLWPQDKAAVVANCAASGERAEG